MEYCRVPSTPDDRYFRYLFTDEACYFKALAYLAGQATQPHAQEVIFEWKYLFLIVLLYPAVQYGHFDIIFHERGGEFEDRLGEVNVLVLLVRLLGEELREDEQDLGSSFGRITKLFHVCCFLVQVNLVVRNAAQRIKRSRTGNLIHYNFSIPAT